VKSDGKAVTIVPRDGARTRLFIAPAGLWLTLDAGKIAAARFDPSSGQVALTLDGATKFTPSARLRIESTSKSADGLEDYVPTARLSKARGAYIVRLAGQPKEILLDRAKARPCSSMNETR